MTSRQEIIDTLERHGLAPNYKLGQNFMVDSSAVRTIVEEADIQPGDKVVEIGPGTGVLTKELIAAGAQVLAVELDAGMVRLLEAEIPSDRLQVVHGDALAGKNALHPAIHEWAMGTPWKLAANLPYDASIPIILNALAASHQVSRIAVTVQLEAAERLCANSGSKMWGASAAVAQSAGSGRIARKLGPQTFYPRPRVQSAILTWLPTQPIPEYFNLWLRKIFAYRRKVISRAVRDCGWDTDNARQAVATAGLSDELRVEMLSVAQLQSLFQALTPLDPT